MRHLSFLFIILSLSCFSSCSTRSHQEVKYWNYEVEPVQAGVEGTYLFKVWSYSTNPDVALDLARRNAIHAVIFKGIQGKSAVSTKPPLTTNSNLENERSDFFRVFFAPGGVYLKYIAIVNNGALDAGDVIKIGREYKVGVIVSVNVALLRKYLEDQKIINSITNGF